MTERIAFLTGHLAQPRLEKVLGSMKDPGFGWSVINVGVKVAALMTEGIIQRRVPRPLDASRVMVPGRCRADLDRLSAEFGIPFERGPDELKDLPAYFGKGGRDLDLSRYDIRIFAEIVDASALGVEAIVNRARAMRAAGADVIDLGSLPDTPFPHLRDAVHALRAEKFVVSVNSADSDELRTGGMAGAPVSAQSRRDDPRHRRRNRGHPCAGAGRPPAISTRFCARRNPPPNAASWRSSIQFLTPFISAHWIHSRAMRNCADGGLKRKFSWVLAISRN